MNIQQALKSAVIGMILGGTLIAAPVYATIVPNSFGFASFFVDTERAATGSMIRSVEAGIYVSTSNAVVAKSFDAQEVVASILNAPGLVGRVLNYPNPFKAGASTEVQFELNQPMLVDVKVYDQFGSRVYSESQNADSGVTKWTFNRAMTGGHLSAGVYYILILNNGKVLGKCKMLVNA